MTTEATHPNVDDPRPLLFGASEQCLGLIEGISSAQLDLPTPCAEFTVRRLCQHLNAVYFRVAYIAGGGNALDVPSMRDDIADDQILAQAQEGQAQIRTAWADDAVMGRQLKLPFGVVPAPGAAFAYVSEFSAHAWDLATALGRTKELDDRYALAALPFARRFIPDTNRGVIPFASPVPVPDDAPPYVQLVAWLGHDPSWTPA